MLSVIDRRTVLGCCSCLRGHLKFADLPFRETAVVVVRTLLLLLLLLRLLRLRLGCLVQAGGFAVVAREVDASGGRGNLALGFEQSRLQVDDVVA